MNHYSGLSTDEYARQLALNGYNSIDTKSDLPIRILLNQFSSPIIFLLIIAATICFITLNIIDGVIVLIILIVNTILGFIQEKKSKSALNKLNKLVKFNVNVYRDENLESVDKKHIVPKDIILLKLGDVVPADCLVLEEENLLVDESSLTGESEYITKIPSRSTKHPTKESILYSGSFIKKGEVTAEVFATGIKSKFGKLQDLSINTNKKTEYEQNLKNVSRALIIVGGVYITLIFILNLIFKPQLNISEILIFAIAIAITIIPEALPIVITLTLSKNAYILGKKGVIVKRLSSIEDLGNIDLLCTDKTGTLTKNEMKVGDLHTENEKDFFKYLYFSSNSSDDPFDKSIENYLLSNSIKLPKNEEYEDIPFNPELKFSERIFKDFAIKKGSSEFILNESHHKSKKKVLAKIEDYESKGYRSISFCVKKKKESYKYLGTLFFVDEIKEDVKETIEKAKREGIQVKVITGDSLAVSSFVGQSVGIIDNNEKAIEASSLNFDNTHVLEEQVKRYSIFARADPIQKYKIIETLQKAHHVGYIGDGINDAPSLKLSNVGIVVENASQIAKESADIILTKKILRLSLKESLMEEKPLKILINILSILYLEILETFYDWTALTLLKVFTNAANSNPFE